MQHSMSSLYFNDLNPYQMVQLFAAHGWRHLELSEGHAYDLLTQGEPTKVGRDFKVFAEDHGITFPQGHLLVARYSNTDRSKGSRAFVDVAPESDADFAKVLDVAKRWIDLFCAIGIPASVLHMGGSSLVDAGWTEEAVLERRTEALSQIAKHAAGAEMDVYVENLCYPHCGTESVEEIQTILAGVDANNVGICFDTGHAVMAELDCVEFVLKAGDQLKTLHIHDNIGLRDDHVLPYERDTIPWDRVLAALGDIKYRGLFNLEIPGRSWCPVQVREAKLDYAKALAAYLVAQILQHNLN
jgi:sugar phosphate isomerase/epimerase